MSPLQKIFTPKFIRVIVGLLVLGGVTHGGIWFWNDKNKEVMVPTLTPRDKTADWQTYRNGQYGFEFRYPSDLEPAYTDDKVILKQGDEAEFSYTISISNDSLEDYLESVSKDGLQLNSKTINVDIKIYKFTAGSSDIVRALVTSGKILLDLRNNRSGSEVFNQILSTFKFIEQDKSVLETYTNTKYNYSIQFPATLKLYPNSANSDLVITGQGYTLCCDYVRITSEERYAGGTWFLYPTNLSTGPNMDATNRLVFEVMKPTRVSLISIDSFFSGFAKEFNGDREDFVINGLPAMRLSYTSSKVDPSQGLFTRTLVKAHDKVYVFTYFRPDLYDEVIRTFSVLDNDKVCIQVITSARNPKTGEIKKFPTPCDVPEGWEKI